jgi:nitroimidazol reductase NimA-like FMN-containing flavoprotein (pyridoxamine 5'-phosphate oxidase superfamily)
LDELVVVLDPDQCWSHLRSARTARVASRTDESLEVIPLNFVAEDRRLFSATSSNVILDAVYEGREIVMEVDEHDGSTAWSVVVRGTVHIPDAQRHRSADAIDARDAETSHRRAGADQHHGAAPQTSCSVAAVSDDERSAPPLIRPSLSPMEQLTSR